MVHILSNGFKVHIQCMIEFNKLTQAEFDSQLSRNVVTYPIRNLCLQTIKEAILYSSDLLLRHVVSESAAQYLLFQRHLELFQPFPLTCYSTGAAILQFCHFLQFLFVKTMSVLEVETGTHYKQANV